jgi:hypothetical protein
MQQEMKENAQEQTQEQINLEACHHFFVPLASNP